MHAEVACVAVQQLFANRIRHAANTDLQTRAVFNFCSYQFADGNALDSLAIDGDGNICAAVLGGGAIGVVSPAGELLDFYHTGNSGTTNICFGGADLRTAYVTLGGSGALVTMQWPRPGLRLAYE